MGRTAAILLLSISLVASVTFEVQSWGAERCIKEDFPPDTLISGKVSVSPVTDRQQLTLRILETHPDKPQSNAILESKEISEETGFSLTSVAEAEYKFCFRDVPKVADGIQNRLVTITWAPKVKDYAEVAKRENLRPIEVEMRKMEDTVIALKNEFDYLKDREATHRDTNESTNSRVAWLSILSVIIVASLGATQVYYLKTYFKSKKLI